MSRTIELFAGIMLLGVGILILGGEWIRGGARGSRRQPGAVVLVAGRSLVGLSLFFLVPAVFGEQHRRLRAGMVIPGALLAGDGRRAAVHQPQRTDGRPGRSCGRVFPFSLGLGMYAAGWIADAPAFKWIGTGVAAGGVDRLPGLRDRLRRGGVPPRRARSAIIALGMALAVGGLAERLSRKTSARS